MGHDFDTMLDELQPFARASLEADGFVAPVAVAIGVDGRLARFAPTGVPETRDPGRLLDALVAALRSAAKERKVRSVAWCVDMRVTPPNTTEKTDALVIFCETPGDALVAVTPYARAETGTRFAERYAQPVEPQIFQAPAPIGAAAPSTPPNTAAPPAREPFWKFWR